MQINWNSKLRWLWREWVRPLGLIVIVLATFRSAAADWYDVPSGSMNPTILEGDRILVNKSAFGVRVPFTMRWIAQWSEPERGDIIICKSPADGKRLVKRVLGVPGDTLELRNNTLYINGQPARYEALEPSYVNAIDKAEQPRHLFAREVTLGEDHPVMVTRDVGAKRTFAPITVPPDQYFVMGDNRDLSHDSRYFGFVDRNVISGRAYAIAWSLDRDHYYGPRWERFLRKLD